MNRLNSLLLAAGGFVVFPLVDSAIKGTLVLLLAASICAMLRRDSAATRHFVWTIAISVLLAMPLLSLVLPTWRILPSWLQSEPRAALNVSPTPVLSVMPVQSITDDRTPVVELESTIVEGVPAGVMEQTAEGAPRTTDPVETVTAHQGPNESHEPLISWSAWLSGIWFVGCFVLTARLLAASAFLRRSARRSYPVMPDNGKGALPAQSQVETQFHSQHLSDLANLQAALESARATLGLKRSVQLLLDPHRSIPIVWGLWKARLQLPFEATRWNAEQLQSVLLHELAHVQRGDLAVLALTQAACALYWFNPLVWFAAWRLHIERERACDDRVLASGVRASAYAEHLLSVATRFTCSPWTQACGLAMAGNSPLHGRLSAVLNARQNRRNVTTILFALSVVASTAFAVPVAMMSVADETAVVVEAGKESNNENSVQKQPLDPWAYRDMDAALLTRWLHLGDSADSVSESRVAGLRSAIGRFIEGIDESPFSLTTEQITELKRLQASDAGKAMYSVSEAQDFIKAVFAIHGEPIQMAFNESPWPGSPGDSEELERLAFGPPDPSGLRVALVCEKETFILGDSARLDLQLWNTGSETLTVGIGRTGPGLYPSLQLETIDQDGRRISTEFGRQSRMLKDIRFTKLWQLRPGETAVVYGYRIRVGSGGPREAEGYPEWYSLIELPKVQHGSEIYVTGILPALTLSDPQSSPVSIQTDSLRIKAIAPEKVEIWTAQTAGRWQMPRGVTLEVKRELFHAADVTTSVVLTWPEDTAGTTHAFSSFVASDAFGNREPWHVAWESNSLSFWTMRGNLSDEGAGPHSPFCVRRIDFADPSNIRTTTWYHKPAEMPEGIRHVFEKVFKPLPTEPRQPSEAGGSVLIEKAHDVRPIDELLFGTWASQSGDVRVRLTFPEKNTDDILCSLDYGTGTPSIETRFGRILYPADNSIRLWIRSAEVQNIDVQDIVGVLRRGPDSSLLLDILETSKHPKFRSVSTISLSQVNTPQLSTIQRNEDTAEQSAKPSSVPDDLLQHLDWSEPVDGLRAASLIRETTADGVIGRERRIHIVIQNVSDKPIRFCDTAIDETDTPAADVEGRKLYLYRNDEIMFALQNAKSTKLDLVLQPRETHIVDMFDTEKVSEPGVNTGDMLAEGILKMPTQAISMVLNIVHAPEGAWKGKLRTPLSRGAIAVQGPMPTSKEGQALFRYCVDHARLNGQIPGGLINRLHDLVQEFIRINSGDEFGDPSAKRMRPLVVRFEHSGDWNQSDVVRLFDDIAEVTTIPLERTMDIIREHTLQRGQPLPASLANVNWGEKLPGGLRMAWIFEPRAEKYPLGTKLKSRVVLHNSGDEPVMFVTRSFHQPEHKAITSGGASVQTLSTYWTTIGRPEPYRLHPGEYCEVNAPGIGVGPQDEELEDWANTRVGSWILASQNDAVVFQPGAIVLTGDHNEKVDADWWLKFITERIQRETPLPVESKEREVVLFRVISDLFGNSPTPEEAEAFLADTSPQAVENLARLLSNRTWHKAVTGSIKSGDIKMQVLPKDPDALTRPRIAMNPGRYTFSEAVRFVVSRRPAGGRAINQADIVWYPPGKENVITNVTLPDGYDTWAACWSPNTTLLWVTQQGLLRSYDFADPSMVRETRYEGPQIQTAPIPSDVRYMLRRHLTSSGL
ncbi:MAG: hypothetical protein JNL58_00405 [Planctomyces sp.]|nr:hypothetical protein [Planctomyces sp.]